MSGHVLTIKDLTVSYRRVPAVHHVDLTLRCGRCVGLLGPNGAGKTSFLKALAGLCPMETGTVQVCGPNHKAGPGSYKAYLPEKLAIHWDFPTTGQGLVRKGR